jgi:hypothetical protein
MQAAAWTDEQIITYFRNALKKEVIDWLDYLPDLKVCVGRNLTPI